MTENHETSRADAFTEDLVLRLVDAHALLQKVPRDEDGIPALDDYASLFSALDYALRGDPGCIEPEEWQALRRRALSDYGEYLGLGWED